MEILVSFTCAGSDCLAIAQEKIDGLSVMNATPLSQLILTREKWPAGWIMRRQHGTEELFCPACQAAGKVPVPAKSAPYKPFR